MGERLTEAEVISRVGEALARLRTRQGLEQVDVAALSANHGPRITQQAISLMERGQVKNLNFNRIRILCQVYGVRLQTLVREAQIDRRPRSLQDEIQERAHLLSERDAAVIYQLMDRLIHDSNTPG